MEYTLTAVRLVCYSCVLYGYNDTGSGRGQGPASTQVLGGLHSLCLWISEFQVVCLRFGIERKFLCKLDSVSLISISSSSAYTEQSGNGPGRESHSVIPWGSWH